MSFSKRHIQSEDTSFLRSRKTEHEYHTKLSTACHAPVMSDPITARALHACSTTEGQWHRDDHTPRDALPWLAEGMRRRRSMPDVGRRQRPADALRRRSLVGFPPGDDVEPRHPPVMAPVYLFASARVGTATTGPVPRSAEAVHTFAEEDNKTCTRRHLPVPHLVSQRTFACPRARPSSFPPTCANDEDEHVQGILKDRVTTKLPQHACLHSASGPEPCTQKFLCAT